MQEERKTKAQLLGELERLRARVAELEQAQAERGAGDGRHHAEGVPVYHAQQLRTLLEHASDLVSIVDSDGTIRYQSPSVEHLLGYRQDALVGRNVFDLVHPADVPGAAQALVRVAERPDTSQQAEVRFKHQDGSWRVLAGTAVNLLHEPGVAGIVLTARDVTERRRMERALAQERKAFQIIAEAALHATDVADLCQRVLAGLVETLGFDFGTIRLYDRQQQLLLPAAVVGRSEEEIPQKFPPYPMDEQRYIAALVARTRRAIFAPDVRQHAVFQTHTSRLEEFDVQSLISWPVLGADQDLLGVIQLSTTTHQQEIAEEDRSFFETVAGMFATALEHKRTEEALRVQTQRNEIVLHTAMDGLLVASVDGTIVEANPAFAALLGYTPGELPGMHSSDIEAQETPEELARHIEVVIQSGHDRFETRLRRKDGQVVDVEASVHFVQVGAESFFFTFARDITERKQAEEELRENVRKFEGLFNSALDGVLIIDDERRIVEVNPAACAQFGLQRDELLGRQVDEFAPPETKLTIDQAWQAFLEQGAYHGTSRWQTGSGARRYTDYTATANFVPGLHLTVSRDITERKHAEDLLRIQRDLGIALSAISDLSEAMSRVLDTCLQVEGIDCGGVYLVDRLTGALNMVCHSGFSSLFIEHASHYGPDSPHAHLAMAGEPVYGRYGEVALLMKEPLQREGLRALAAIPVRHRGQVIAMINLASHTHDEIPTGARHALETIAARLGSAIDRMRAEETLRENEEQFRALGESAPIGIFLTDAEDLCTYTNTRLQSISGLTLEQSLGHGWYRAIHPDDLGAVLAALSAQAEEGRQFSREFRLLTPQGEVRWVHVRAAPMVSEGNLLGRVGTVEDITERKRAMQALARERKAFRIIADAAVQATDVPGLCRQILTGLVETLGFDLGTIRLYDKQSQILLPTAVVGSSPEELPDEFPPYSLDDRKCVAALVARTRQAFFAPEVHKHAVFQTHFAIISAFGVRSLIAWPILGTQNDLLGVMQLSAFKPMDIPEEDRSFFETVAGMFATVLEHRQAEEARRDSEERYRLLFERNLAGVYRTTLEGRILDCNAAFVRLLGYDTRQEVLERSAWDFYFDSAERETFLVHLQESGALTDYESCLRRRDGSPVWVLENTGLHEQDGVGVIQGTCINITERKQAEEAYRTLVEHSLQGLVITQDGRPVFVNQVFAEMSGYSVEELLAMPVEDAWAILCPEDRVATWGRYQERLRGERPPERRELCAFRKDGSRFWMEVHVSPIEFQGRPAIQAATIDITERKRAEAERENLIGELDSFAHTVAHNLTNPLSSILSFAKLMDDAALPEAKQRRYLDFIVQTGQKMLNITDELMLLAGVRRGEVEVRPLDTAKIITEARKRLVYMIEKYQAEIVIPDAWPLALGHAPWVEEVWVNYLSNAIKYGGSPPHVALGARLEDGMVRFWVRDNGPGIPAEKQDKLFAPFTTFDQVSTKGHGLGLSIVRRIVERLDGQIGVESAEGQGSTFFFTLPACDELDLL